MTKKQTYEELFNKIVVYNDIRGWKQKPSDLAKSIMIEGAELLEHFQWDETSSKSAADKNWEEIGFEVADVMWYLVMFCDRAGINLQEVLEKKYQKNELKFPAEKFAKGGNVKFYKDQKKMYREAKARGEDPEKK